MQNINYILLTEIIQVAQLLERDRATP